MSKRFARSLTVFCMLAFALLVAGAGFFARPAYAETVNLALGKSVTASSHEADNVLPENAVDGNTTDKQNSRWGSNLGDRPAWITVDLGQSCKISSIEVYWERHTALKYEVQISNADANPGVDGEWTTVYSYDKEEPPADTHEVFELDQVMDARFVRLYIEDYLPADPTVSGDVNWDTISIYELMVNGEGTGESTQDPQQNVALNKGGEASSVEAATLAADKLTDGDTSTKSSRWSSSVGAKPSWVYIDLGASYDVSTIRLYWERRNATNYKVQISNAETVPTDDSGWTDVYTSTSAPANKMEDITVADGPQKARFVRVYISDYVSADQYGDGEWNSVSLYEIEVYGGDAPMSPGDLADQIVVNAPQKGDTRLDVTMPEAEGYKVEFRGADYEQIVDSEFNINTPLVNKDVKLAFKITDTTTGSYQLVERTVTIPGEYETNPGAEAPVILPELSEWAGGEGTFTVGASTKIYYTDASLKSVAELFAADLSEVLGLDLTAEQGEGDGIVFTQSNDAEHVALGEEGYTLSVTGSRVTVTGSANGSEWDATTSANWGAQTLLQAFEQGKGSMAQGEARDYPLYKVRGIILDVGRKTFTMDWLDQLAREMAYYKMNDLNVHLNDNFIGIESYVADGIDPADLEKGAYSGFRMESDITEGTEYTFGGKQFTARTNLTSSDLSYTKDEFANYINKYAELGVNISPEIDTPAHSLAITKVFPDLSYGVMRHRNRDHLDIINQYDAVLDMAETIWGEYVGEGDAFSGARYINIGADEFNVSGKGDHDTGNALATGVAYRMFVNDLSNFMLDKGYTPRVWGSLSNYSGDNSMVERADEAQVLLWNSGYADITEMYNMGYQLINCDDGTYYIVPGATYYYDYLNPSTMYNAAINTQNATIPAGDPQMVGGMFAAWNDMVDRSALGISEYDVYDRLHQSMGLFAAKLWGKPADALSLEEAQGVMSSLGLAPGTNPGYAMDANEDGTYVQLGMDDQTDASGMDRGIAELKNATIEDLGYTGALKLNGGESYAKLNGIETLGLGSDLRVKVMRTSDSTDEQVLFESPYGKILAVQDGTGKVGISREDYDFTFDYTLPVGEWVELEFKNVKDQTSLFVNGQLVQTVGSGTRGAEHATNMFPLAYVGSATNAFEGYVNDVYVTASPDVTTTEYASTISLLYAVQTADAVLAEQDVPGLADAIEAAKAVIDQVNPEKSAIDTAAAAIDDALAGADYEKADYTMVEKYLALVPEDLSAFTPETAGVLEQAIAGIREGLPAGMQETVDGYVSTLVAALDGLELQPARDLNFIDSATLTATACSQQSNSGAEGPATNVLDGSVDTLWHTLWNGDGCDEHWIELSKKDGSPMTVNGLEYTPRSGGGNGTATSYRVEVKNADGGWDTVAEGTWDTSGAAKTVSFDTGYTTTAVRLVIVEGVGGFGSAAEIRLGDGAVSADVEGLQSVVDFADTLTEDEFTTESWAAYQEALAAAQALLDTENPDATQVEAAKANVLAAQVALRFVAEDPEPEPEPEPVDKTVLTQRVATAEELAASGSYTDESVKALQDAIDSAKEVLAQDDATQEAVDAADAALAAAIRDLVEKPGQTVDTSELKDAINDAASLVKDDYTAESWAAFEEALKAANEALTSDDQAKIDAALEALNEAKAALVEATTPGGGEEPGGEEPGGDQKPGDTTPGGDTKPGDTTKPGTGTSKPGTTTGTGSTVPETGDNSLPVMGAAVTAGAVLAAGLLLRRKAE